MLRKGRSVSRLEGFSDAVFAFSSTLLVVSLEVPETFPELVTELRGFVAFGVSFGALALIWSVHNAFFRRYDLDDRTTIILNSCLLFVVLFYVYPLKFMVEGLSAAFLGLGNGNMGVNTFEDLSLLFVLYGGGFVAVFGCFSLLYRHAVSKAVELWLDEPQRAAASFYFRHYLIFVGVGLLSITLAATGLVYYGLPGWIYALLGPLCYYHGIKNRHKLKLPERVYG